MLILLIILIIIISFSNQNIEPYGTSCISGADNKIRCDPSYNLFNYQYLPFSYNSSFYNMYSNPYYDRFYQRYY
jgi:hypothetical protein